MGRLSEQAKKEVEQWVAYIEEMNQSGIFSQCGVVMTDWPGRALNMLTIKPANDMDDFYTTVRRIEYAIHDRQVRERRNSAKRRMATFKRVAKSLNQRTNHDIARS